MRQGLRVVAALAAILAAMPAAAEGIEAVLLADYATLRPLALAGTGTGTVDIETGSGQ